MAHRNKSILYPLFTLAGANAGLLLLRLFAGAMLLPHGIQKAQNFTALSSTFADPIGLGSKFSLVLIISAEIGGSILVMTGLLTRMAALAVAFGMFVAAFLSYPGPFTMKSSETPLLYMGMFSVIIIAGAGKYSIDNALRHRLQ